MEEYEQKVSYLVHLKNISAIRNGHSKRTAAFSPNPKSNRPEKLKALSNSRLHSNRKAKDELMHHYFIEKENFRLVERLASVPSIINMKKNERDYIDRKKIIRIHHRKTKESEWISFRLYDIAFQHLRPDPEEIFRIYETLNKEKTLLAQGNIFDLRKKEIKLKKSPSAEIRIEGKVWGSFSLLAKPMLILKRNREEVGNVVIDLI